MKRLKKYFSDNNLIIWGIIGLFISFLLSLVCGSYKITISGLLKVLLGAPEYNMFKNIIIYVRLPRTIAAMMSGAGLAVSGAILQSVLSNKLASPGIIGVNAGAGLGVSLAAAFSAASGILFSLSAFLGSLCAVFIVTIAASKVRASKSTVILGGVAVNAIFNAFSESISVLYPDAAILNSEFRIGGFSSVSYIRLIPAGVLIIISLLILFTLLNELDVLSLGDETAAGLGMSVKKTKTIFLILCALLSGASVSFSGLLGFIGLIVPNFIREITGSESKKLIPLCAVYGAIFVTLCDILARTLFTPYEIPVGIFMAIIGGPFFVMILLRTRGGKV